MAVVGAHGDDENQQVSGSAYVFDVTTGQQVLKLIPSDGAANDSFSRHAVSISGDLAVIGAFRDDDTGSRSGSAYVFDVTTGDELAKLTSLDAAAEDEFGWSVSVGGGKIIVGAHLNDTGGLDAGSAYLFDVPEPVSAWRWYWACRC